MIARPTFRNVSGSFESWAYRNGLKRQLDNLERRKFVETQAPGDEFSPVLTRVLRLTEAGRLLALGGRDPETQWRRRWNGRWHLVLFDLPNAQTKLRDRLRRYLRSCNFGYLQNSVWISPDPLTGGKAMFEGAPVNVESLLLLEARPCAGESDREIVLGAWDFDKINRLYERHDKVLSARPTRALRDETAAKAFRRWTGDERVAWLSAVSADPLLPEALLPQSYRGREAWQNRLQTLQRAAEQIRGFNAKG